MMPFGPIIYSHMIVYVCFALANQEKAFALENLIRSFYLNRTAGNIYSVNVTYVGRKDHFYISDFYPFYPPKIHVSCECWCKRPYEHVSNCVSFCITQQQSNLTTTWNAIEKKTIEKYVCPFYVRLQCQVSFSIPNSKKQNYYALRIRSPVSIYRLGFQILDETINKTDYFELDIPSGIENILVTEDIYMKFGTPNENLSPTIPSQWYFVKTENINANQDLIMYAPNDRGINEKGECCFTKLGWFQALENIKLPFLSKTFFERHLSIKSKTCDASQSSIDWNLNDSTFFYNSSGHLKDHGGRFISDLYPDMSSNVTLKFLDKTLITHKTSLREINIIMSPRLKTHTNFNVSIYKKKKTESETFDLYLVVSFNNDSDFHYVDIGIENSVYGINAFNLKDLNQSSQNPFSKRLKLPENIVLNDPEWICMYNVNEMRHKLCQTVTIEDERNEEFSTCAENTTSQSQVSATSVSDSRLIIIISLVSVVAVVVVALWLLWQLKKTKKKGTHCKDFSNLVDINMDENDETSNLLKPISWTILKNLRDKYEAIQWFLNEGYTDYGLVEDPTSPQFDSKTALKLEDIFQDDKQPRRILIKGGIGCGKTTLSRKLACDWAGCKSYLQKFDITILIHLSDLTTGLKDAVIARLRCGGISVDRIVRDLERNLSSVLLVLDGYDELKHDLNSEVNDLIRKKFYSEMTVIVTCKTEWSRIKTPVKTNLRIFSSSNDSDVWDKIYVLSGIHNDEKKPGKHGDILITPLIANMLKQISNSAIATEGIKNLEQLYKMFFVHLIKLRDCQKDDDTRLKELGKIAWAKLSTRQFSFTNKEVSKNSKLNFLRENGIIFKKLSDDCNQRVCYSALHISFLEFLAAFYLCNLFHSNERNITLEKEIKGNGLMPFCYRGNFMLFSFLTGLLNAKNIFLLKFLQMDTYKFHFTPHMLIKHLLHCEMSETLLRDLNTFIPSVWSIPWFHDEQGSNEFKLHDFVLKYGLKQKIINTVKWDPNYNILFEENLHVDKFELEFQDFVNDLEPNLNSIKSFACSEFICSFSVKNENEIKKTWSFFQTMTKRVTFKRFVLQVWFCVSNILELFCSNNFSENFKVAHLQCRIELDRSDEYDSLIKFIKQFQLESLSIEITRNHTFTEHIASDFQDPPERTLQTINKYIAIIARIVAASKETKKLIIRNFIGRNLRIDLNDLNCNGKQYDQLWFEGLVMECKGNVSLTVKELNYFSSKITGNLNLCLENGWELEFKNLESVCCEAEQFYKDSHKTPPIILFEQLKEFETTLGEENYNVRYLEVVKHMKNLEILSLNLKENSASNIANLVYDFEQMFKSSFFKTLLFWNVKTNYNIFFSLLNCIKNIENFNGGMNNFKRLQVHFDLNQVMNSREQCDYFRKLLQTLKVVQEKFKTNVSFVSESLSTSFSDNFMVFQEMDNFAATNKITFKHDFDGSKSDDSFLSKAFYSMNKYYHRFTMELKCTDGTSTESLDAQN